MTLAEKERQALADLLLQVGPEAPTRCEGWTTQDLLVHLLVRERRPGAFLGTFLSAAKGWLRRAEDGYRRRPWAEQVEMFRKRPSLPSPIHFSQLDDVFNSGELFIHHEDVRRGEPGWQVRDYDPETAAKLDAIVRSRLLKLELRRAGVGVVALLPAGDRLVLRSGTPVVEVHADPGEIVIWASGRAAVKVSLSGPPDAVQTLQRNGFEVNESA